MLIEKEQDGQDIFKHSAYPAAEGDPAREADPVILFKRFIMQSPYYTSLLNRHQIWIAQIRDELRYWCSANRRRTMFLKALISTICLCASPMLAECSVETMLEHHLDTPEGRLAFLTDKLTAYAERAEQLNGEVLHLSEEIQALSPVEDQQRILALSEELTGKMDTLLNMLPILTSALTIDEDFQELDIILQQTDPLSPEQQQVIDRITSLCDSLGGR